MNKLFVLYVFKQLFLVNGCKSKKNLKRLDILKIIINLKSMFYEEKKCKIS